jgi:hypothetical protein
MTLESVRCLTQKKEQQYVFAITPARSSCLQIVKFEEGFTAQPALSINCALAITRRGVISTISMN